MSSALLTPGHLQLARVKNHVERDGSVLPKMWRFSTILATSLVLIARQVAIAEVTIRPSGPAGAGQSPAFQQRAPNGLSELLEGLGSPNHAPHANPTNGGLTVKSA